MNCPKCQGTNVQKRGTTLSEGGIWQRYQCTSCNKPFYISLEEEVEQRLDAKIAIIDVETLPHVAYTWGVWEQNISPNQLIQQGCLLSWGYKELNSSEDKGEILTSREAIDRNPKRIITDLWKLLSKTDIVIGHNYQDFDRKVINTAFLLNGLPPLKYKIVDTLKIVRENFSLPSNKMAAINDTLGIRNKISNEGFELWRKCSNGDVESLKTMLEYNVGDLYASEELYYRVRSFASNHPNLALYNDITEKQCPVCASTDLKVEGLYPPTAKSRYESVRCTKCGSLSRLNTNLISAQKRKSILSR